MGARWTTSSTARAACWPCSARPGSARAPCWRPWRVGPRPRHAGARAPRRRARAVRPVLRRRRRAGRAARRRATGRPPARRHALGRPGLARPRAPAAAPPARRSPPARRRDAAARQPGAAAAGHWRAGCRRTRSWRSSRSTARRRSRCSPTCPTLAERERIVDDARGIPLYLREFARTVGQPASTLTCPLLAAAEVELRALPPATRSLVEGAAVAGDPFDPELAAAAAGQEHVAEAVDELVAADIVRPGTGRDFAFRHPLVLPRRLPRRGARLAAGRPRARRGGAGAARRGRGGARASRRAVRAAGRRGGGRAARRGGWRTAPALVRGGAAPGPRRATAAALLGPAGLALARAGRLREALALLAELDSAEPDLVLVRAQLEATLGDPDAARRRLRAAPETPAIAFELAALDERPEAPGHGGRRARPRRPGAHRPRAAAPRPARRRLRDGRAGAGARAPQPATARGAPRAARDDPPSAARRRRRIGRRRGRGEARPPPRHPAHAVGARADPLLPGRCRRAARSAEPLDAERAIAAARAHAASGDTERAKAAAAAGRRRRRPRRSAPPPRRGRPRAPPPRDPRRRPPPPHPRRRPHRPRARGRASSSPAAARTSRSPRRSSSARARSRTRSRASTPSSACARDHRPTCSSRLHEIRATVPRAAARPRRRAGRGHAAAEETAREHERARTSRGCDALLHRDRDARSASADQCMRRVRAGPARPCRPLGRPRRRAAAAGERGARDVRERRRSCSTAATRPARPSSPRRRSRRPSESGAARRRRGPPARRPRPRRRGRHRARQGRAPAGGGRRRPRRGPAAPRRRRAGAAPARHTRHRPQPPQLRARPLTHRELTVAELVARGPAVQQAGSPPRSVLSERRRSRTRSRGSTPSSASAHAPSSRACWPALSR